MSRSRASLGIALSCAATTFTSSPAWPVDVPVVEAVVDSMTATIGDGRELSVYVQASRGWTPLFPIAPPELPVDGLVAAVETQPGQGEADRRAAAKWTLRFFELGQHRLDGIPVSFVDDSGDTVVVLSNPLDISVISVREEDEEGLRDIKPPFATPGGLPLWLLAIVATLLVVGVAALMRRFLIRKEGDLPHTSPAQPVDYVREFARIEEMGLVARGALKLHYSLLSETLRRFLQDRVEIAAPDLTTREISAELRHTFDDAQVTLIEQFLAAADMVKFAKASPPREDSLAAPETGKTIVRDVESLLKPAVADIEAESPEVAQPMAG